MRIESSTMNLAASRSYRERTVEEETFRVWQDGQARADGRGTPPGLTSGSPAVQSVSLPGVATGVETTAPPLAEQKTPEELRDVLSDFKSNLLRKMLEHLTGKSFRGCDEPRACRQEPAPPAPQTAPPASAGETQRVGWGMEYQYRREHFESESTSFRAQGIVRTADGQAIAIDVSLKMHREYLEREAIDVRAGDALVDPLVINFDGTAAELTERTFEFDLDADGTTEQLHQLAGGNAFLALDRNGNGTIDDGSELFGPSTGQGLAELRALDADGNGWLDESDPMFARLGLFRPAEDGAGSLASVRQRNVGAIYLQGVDTRFDLKDEQQNLLGRVRESTIALGEDASVMLVQQIDLAT